MFNEFGVINPDKAILTKYIDEFNTKVRQAIATGNRGFHINEVFHRETLYDFVLRTLDKEEFKNMYEGYNFKFGANIERYIVVSW